MKWRECGSSCHHQSTNLRCERGGGSKPQPAQVIQAPPPPSVEKTAGESFAAQLQYNPQLTAQAAQLQQQYGPQFAQGQLDIARQFTPQYRALLESQFPQINTLSGQVQNRLLNPQGLTPDQQAAQQAIRQRAYDASASGIRESANLGGTLYGGNRQLREDRARNELAQGFATQDIGLEDQRRQQTMQELISLFQLAGLQVQQPNVPQYGQSVVPGGDNLYNALIQNQGNFGVIPGNEGTPGFFGSLARGFGSQF